MEKTYFDEGLMKCGCDVWKWNCCCKAQNANSKCKCAKMCNWNEVANVKKYCKTTKKNEAVSRKKKKKNIDAKSCYKMQTQYAKRTKVWRGNTNTKSYYKCKLKVQK